MQLLIEFPFLSSFSRSLHHTGDGTNSADVSGTVVDPSVGVGGAANSGLSAYGHSSQDYGRSSREVYHPQTLAEGQGRPNSNQTMYNPSAAAASQYETASSQAVEGPSNSVLNRLPSGGSAKQTPSPTASSGYVLFLSVVDVSDIYYRRFDDGCRSTAWSTHTTAPSYSAYEGVSPSRSPGNYFYERAILNPGFHVSFRSIKGGSSGPTYTQLGSSAASGRAGYHQSAGHLVDFTPRPLLELRSNSKCLKSIGLWHWQSPIVPPAETSPNNGGPSGPGGTTGVGVPTTSTATHPSQGSELVTDMLQMLDHSGASGFEDLNMFSSNFE